MKDLEDRADKEADAFGRHPVLTVNASAPISHTDLSKTQNGILPPRG